MINLELPEELKQLKTSTYEFIMGLFRPISRKYDKQEHVYPKELDVMRSPVSSGNFARSKKKEKSKEPREKPTKSVTDNNLRSAVITEELAHADVGLMMTIPNSAPGNLALKGLASDEQMEKFGGKWTAFSITEPETGSDSGAVSTTAVLDGDEWVLNGEKIFVTAADRCDNVIVFATVDKSAGKAGIKPFLVEKGTPGFTLEKLEKKMGLRASDTGNFILNNCRIPKKNILGVPEVEKDASGGFKGAMSFFDSSRPVVGIMSTGVARAALDYTREKLEENGYRLNYHENSNNVSSMEKEYYQMEASLEALRLLTWRAFWMLDEKQPNSSEASMCKAKGGRVAALITQKCCELLGPLGFSTKELAEKWMRDARIMDIFEGTGQIQHLVIARNVLNLSSKELK
ncbi:MAG: acyl-CoA dehydrogenase family protein [Deltaproteobacteria bacterium]|nr:acyl-CoA dehydrogenase family protein [Deltaproteobacteria bacterium]